MRRCQAATVRRRKSIAKALLAKDKVTFAGEAIAMVIAETYAQASDAAELVEVDYEPLDAVGTLEAAPHRPADLGRCAGQSGVRLGRRQRSEMQRRVRAGRAHDRARYRAEPRLANPMETRNAIGLYDAARECYTLYSGTQGAGGLA